MPQKFQVAVKGIFVQGQRVLLLEFESDSWGKSWDLPGGRIDEEETFAAAFTREIAEELTGITNPKLIKLLHAERAPKRFPDGSSLIWLFFRASGDIAKEINFKDEHTGLRWASAEDLAALEGTPSRPFPPGFLLALRKALAK